ncbi:hypothetical protein DFH08DRAFT_859557 [Mycena albidolilacea]|uniref:Uncharacterized protein n=1 Tax=Mycena albidolilacea TaxID=1033008 RepID=A0AAD7AAE4_9AGAR|nr:hypothetical protein DFH08DRAFT_859557 [Mycena albidolilacea]
MRPRSLLPQSLHSACFPIGCGKVLSTLAGLPQRLKQGIVGDTFCFYFNFWPAHIRATYVQDSTGPLARLDGRSWASILILDVRHGACDQLEDGACSYVLPSTSTSKPTNMAMVPTLLRGVPAALCAPWAFAGVFLDPPSLERAPETTLSIPAHPRFMLSGRRYAGSLV